MASSTDSSASGAEAGRSSSASAATNRSYGPSPDPFRSGRNDPFRSRDRASARPNVSPAFGSTGSSTRTPPGSEEVARRGDTEVQPVSPPAGSAYVWALALFVSG